MLVDIALYGHVYRTATFQQITSIWTALLGLLHASPLLHGWSIHRRLLSGKITVFSCGSFLYCIHLLRLNFMYQMLRLGCSCCRWEIETEINQIFLAGAPSRICMPWRLNPLRSVGPFCSGCNKLHVSDLHILSCPTFSKPVPFLGQLLMRLNQNSQATGEQRYWKVSSQIQSEDLWRLWFETLLYRPPVYHYGNTPNSLRSYFSHASTPLLRYCYSAENKT